MEANKFHFARKVSTSFDVVLKHRGQVFTMYATQFVQDALLFERITEQSQVRSYAAASSQGQTLTSFVNVSSVVFKEAQNFQCKMPLGHLAGYASLQNRLIFTTRFASSSLVNVCIILFARIPRSGITTGYV
jgi:hypothetical protein